MDQIKVSVLITAWRESKTIGKCIRCIGNVKYSGIDPNFEIILAAPDNETYIEALKAVKELNIENKFKYIQDPGKGKPFALNLLIKEARGEKFIFTDGDVWFNTDAVGKIIHKLDVGYDIVTGRPKSADSKDNMMGYYGNLLSDAAHHKRTVDLTKHPVGKSLRFVKKRLFFPVSGYIYATKKTDIKFPNDCLVDDAYISYVMFNKGLKIGYAAKAVAYVKYPTNLKDYFKQKKRSTGGYVQLWEYGVVKPETKSRSFWRELEYFWFPIYYAKNLKELLWSLYLYPIRLWLWIIIYWERKILKKDFVRTWVRIESTK